MYFYTQPPPSTVPSVREAPPPARSKSVLFLLVEASCWTAAKLATQWAMTIVVLNAARTALAPRRK